jgi:hypothetical protein
METLKNELRQKIAIKSQVIDGINREVVDLEVGLAKVVSKRKEVGLENDSLNSKLEKMTKLSLGKIEEMSTKLYNYDEELYETKVYFKDFNYTMEHEKERILFETRDEFESEMKPIQN